MLLEAVVSGVYYQISMGVGELSIDALKGGLGDLGTLDETCFRSRYRVCYA
jgi:hypothetical protein